MANLDVLYSPYGAYELKSKYQRNFLLSTIILVLVVALILLTAFIISKIRGNDLVAIDAPQHITTIAELGSPPSIAKRPPQIKVNRPNVVAPKIGIPKPVADEDVLNDDVVLATREQLAQIVAPDITSSSGGDKNIVVDIKDEDYLPSPDEFVPVEILPEMIHQETPKYPRLAKQAGITGVVWVKALVDKEGNVRKAIVGKSSGTASLDDAAVKTAYKNKFKPGIQNGRPVNVWVTYKVVFELND